MVWCAFLGAFGAHRFYLGEKGLGWLYLGFSWTLIPLVAAFLDFALLAMQDDEDFAEERREIPLLKPPKYERPSVLGTGSLSPATAVLFGVGEAIDERKRGGGGVMAVEHLSGGELYPVSWKRQVKNQSGD
jgi:hypothetical protein